MPSKKLNIMLVEDDPCDVFLLRKKLKEGLDDFELTVLRDGVLALDYLRQVGPYKDAPTPDLILLDIGLPGVDGWEILAHVKADPALSLIPIVVITGYILDEAPIKRFGLDRKHYISKWIDIAEFSPLIKQCLAAHGPQA